MVARQNADFFDIKFTSFSLFVLSDAQGSNRGSLKVKKCYASLIAAALLASGCVVGVRSYGMTVDVQLIQFTPMVEVTPGFTPTVTAYVPNSYVWDGSVPFVLQGVVFTIHLDCSQA